ncbi:MAG: hypothetical protein KDC54_03400 [Lewinella sp.]|nr:hypothetical protein [Lewinella sp.]
MRLTLLWWLILCCWLASPLSLPAQFDQFIARNSLRIQWDSLYQEYGLTDAELLEEEEMRGEPIYQRWQLGDSIVRIHLARDQQYLFTVSYRGQETTRGLLVPSEGLSFDTIRTYDPLDFSETRYYVSQARLVRDGVWTVTHRDGRVESGEYDTGRRTGWWFFREKEGDFTAYYEDDLLRAYGQVEGLASSMVQEMIRGRWYLSRLSMNLREDPELEQYEVQGETWVLTRRLPDHWRAALDLSDGLCQFDAAPTGSPYDSGLYPWALEADHTLSFDFGDGQTQRARILFLSEGELKLAFD